MAKYGRIAEGCGHRLEAGTRGHARWCSSACRQAAYRLRINPELRARGDRRDRPRLAVLDGFASTRENPRPSARPDVVPATSPRRPTGDEPTIPPHEHSGRLCAVCMSSRHLEVRVAPRARRSAELLAHEIRKARGDIGPALDAGYSDRQAYRIRGGWRGAGRTADPIPYRSRGYADGYKIGRHPEDVAERTGRPVELPSHGRDVLERSRVAAARGAELAELAARTLELARSIG